MIKEFNSYLTIFHLFTSFLSLANLTAEQQLQSMHEKYFFAALSLITFRCGSKFFHKEPVITEI
jgi:hypothetical protein